MTRIVLITTGGTVAMERKGARGAQVAIGGARLATAVTLPEGCQLEVLDLTAQPSASLAFNDLLALRDAVEAAQVAGADGVVVTHGTDTLEETAFALDLMLPLAHRPVVLTGAMRRPDQAGADGFANLAAAIAVAASSAAVGLGPLVVMDDEIHAARWVRKVHAFRAGAAFSSTPLGPVGWVAEGRIRIFMRPERLPFARRAEPSSAIVPILFAGAGLEEDVVDAVSSIAAGLVVAAPGAGHVSSGSVSALARAATRIPVILVSRTGAGEVFRETYGYPGGEIDLLARGLHPGGALTPVKARIMLQCLLACGVGRDAIPVAFEGA